MADCEQGPTGLVVTPSLINTDSVGTFLLKLACVNPNLYLPKSQVTIRAKVVLSPASDDQAPAVLWTEEIGKNRPMATCHLLNQGSDIPVTGMLDTGADVTVISTSNWPSSWPKQAVPGTLRGVGGCIPAYRSSNAVSVVGPDGQVANVKPFIIDTNFNLWGRDTMSQWGTRLQLAPSRDLFLGAIEECPTPALNWLTNEPVSVKQWPIYGDKLRALNELVDEQLEKGHIVPSNSPWNSPVFVIKKKGGGNRWRLLHDLRQINAVIEDMGSLQPGLPSPAMLPRDWKMAIVDIKDCFFQIPLHPSDAPRFAFSVPTLNRQAPMRRFHWRVLPQGMKCSPTICQWYVARILAPVRELMSKAIIVHYMDDVLVCAQSQRYVDKTLSKVIGALESKGFEIQPSKVQRTAPWKYLGMRIFEQTIKPVPIKIVDNPRNLAEFHQLCGQIEWIRPFLGVSTADLAPLYNMLRGDRDLTSPRKMTPEAKEAIVKVEQALQRCQTHRFDPKLTFQLAVIGNSPHYSGIIHQWDDSDKDSLRIIEWVFLSVSPDKTVTTPLDRVARIVSKARSRLATLAGCDFEKICLPLTNDQLEDALKRNVELQVALDSYAGQTTCHYPKHKLFKCELKMVKDMVQSRQPLKALTVFTDGSGKTGKSVITWQNPSTLEWEKDVEEIEGSSQVAELAAVVRAFDRFPEPFNLVTDSAYVAGIVSRAEDAWVPEHDNPKIGALLAKLMRLLSHRKQPYYILHTRAHTKLPGFVAEGNRVADALAAPVSMATLPDRYQQAVISHSKFHQNAQALKRDFGLTKDQARAITVTCPNCQLLQLPSIPRVNPRGLGSCELWQMDVTHIAEFGRLKYVHVSIDTFSGAIYATAHSGEKAKDVISHLIQAFAVLGIPKEIKTDNAPSYVSEQLRKFFLEWGISHTTGIPHSPTGQALVERSHQTLKRMLQQQKGGTEVDSPHIRLARALFTLNFLNCSESEPDPPVLRHFYNSTRAQLKERPQVLIREPDSKKISGPYPLVVWGRGYGCVATPGGPKWIPAKFVKPFHQPSSEEAASKTQEKQAAWKRRKKKPNQAEESPASSPSLSEVKKEEESENRDSESEDEDAIAGSCWLFSLDPSFLPW